MVRRILSRVGCFLVGLFLASVVLPLVLGYLAYGANFGGVVEQRWLDTVINDLQSLRSDCDDPELDAVLEYTIQRYSRIGPFDVAISRCDWYPIRDKTLGLNNPVVPGITIDIDVATKYPVHVGVIVLVHEALHDYSPYFGHEHITPILDKLEKLHVHRQRNHSGS